MRIEAAFDCLSIVTLLEEINPNPTKGEVHLLAYLASLLSVYARRGEGASQWGYTFTATPSGAPFSEDLEVEMQGLISSGAFRVIGSTLQLTTAGTRLQGALSELDLVKSRLDYLDSASATLYAMPVGMVRAAFAHDPDLILAGESRVSRSLISRNALARLYAEFDAVADVLQAANENLLAASVLWLTYLAERESIAFAQ